jgi:hypothetical protein
LTEHAGRPFRLWAFGDAHVGTDLRRGHGRRSLAEALSQSERRSETQAPFEWDIAIDVGDMSGAGNGRLPRDDEGEEIVRQLGVLERHGREHIYHVGGNHDRSGLDEPDGWWWQKWIDPLGENAKYSGVHAERRPYPAEGKWYQYSFRLGNVLFLMMSDRNVPGAKIGRGPLGGNPGGCVHGETFEWWKSMVESNRDSIIVSVHHYVLKNTTVASGEWEGLRKDEHGNWKGHYHGYYPNGGYPKGASYLYLVDDREDAQAFESYLAENPGSIDLWLAGHTHTHPDDTYGGKSHIEQKWGVHFLNVCALTRYHITGGFETPPMSRLLTFRDGSPDVHVGCYLHDDFHAPQGWYPPAERTLRLSRPFRREP